MEGKFPSGCELKQRWSYRPTLPIFKRLRAGPVGNESGHHDETRRRTVQTRLLMVIVTMSLAVTACASVPAADAVSNPAPETETGLDRSGDEVKVALDDLSEQIRPALSLDEDVNMAWSDFEHDFRSVVDDLVRDPDSVDLDGVRQRINALGELIAHSEVNLPESHWEEFVAAFSTLVDEVSSA